MGFENFIKSIQESTKVNEKMDSFPDKIEAEKLQSYLDTNFRSNDIVFELFYDSEDQKYYVLKHGPFYGEKELIRGSLQEIYSYFQAKLAVKSNKGKAKELNKIKALLIDFSKKEHQLNHNSSASLLADRMIADIDKELGSK
jgi:hypothetical protein